MTGGPLATPMTADLGIDQDKPEEQDPPAQHPEPSRLRWENAQYYGDDQRHDIVSVDWVFSWYTTLCFNDPYLHLATAEFLDIFGGDAPEALAGSWNQVANLYIDHVETSAGNPDFTKYDPEDVAELGYDRPTVSFDIVDDGPAYGYRWEVYAGQAEGTPFMGGTVGSPCG